jgi:hypothetical protein
MTIHVTNPRFGYGLMAAGLHSQPSLLRRHRAGRRSGARIRLEPETAFIFNTLLFLIGGFLVMWMAAGFAMLEAGLVRSKNVSMQCLKNIALYSIAGLMFWVIGYNLMYTGVDGGYFGTLRPYSWILMPATTAERGRLLGCLRLVLPDGVLSPPPPRSSPARWPSASSCGRS